MRAQVADYGFICRAALFEKAPRQASSLIVSDSASVQSVAIGPDLSSSFAGARALMTLQLDNDLRTLGFTDVDDLGPAEIGARFFGARTQPGRAGGHVIRASKQPTES